ncbi:MAG: UDP-N-acetylglucosamine 2-epimerase [Bdellovibrionota bacterium]
MRKKIIGITSTRSDYDLLSPMYRKMARSSEFDISLVASGMHLETKFGETIDLIEEDRIPIGMKVKTIFDGDQMKDRCISASILFNHLIEYLDQKKPDLVTYAGDREDTIVAATVCGYLGIPSAHFYAGDHTRDGYIDNPIRHAVSKLSTILFTCCNIHAERLAKIGEPLHRIFNIGSIALDNFYHEKEATLEELCHYFKRNQLPEKYAVVIFHPTVEEKNIGGEILQNILNNLSKKNIFCFLSYPNSDPSSQSIIDTIEKQSGSKKIHTYKSLPREIFISLYKNASMIVGNSSSGIAEAASIPIPAINVGMRQKGRSASKNVLFVDSDNTSILRGIEKALDQKFIDENVKGAKNIYGSGGSADRAIEIIRSMDFTKLLLKKEDPLEP